MATAYLILKQTPKARNQLKRIAKMDWNSEVIKYTAANCMFKVNNKVNIAIDVVRVSLLLTLNIFHTLF